MAFTISEAEAISSKHYDKSFTSQVYEDSAFYLKLKKMGNVRVDGGTQIQWGVRMLELGKADAVNPREQIQYSQKETRTAAVADWKYYIVDMMVSWDERVKCSGKEAQINLLADKTEEGQEDFANRFATDLWTANPKGNGITPISSIVDSADTFGGITVASAANWASTEDSTTTVLELYGAGSLSYMTNQATFGKAGPDAYFTTRNLASTFESRLEPQKRYEDKEMADAGFGGTLTFHKKPVIADPLMPAGSFYGLCMKMFQLRYHEEWNFKVDKWESAKQYGYPNAMIKTVSWAGNLTCKMRRCHFKFTALDYTL